MKVVPNSMRFGVMPDGVMRMYADEDRFDELMIVN
jgi:hypothetical protein